MCDCEFDNVHVGSESTALTCVIINMTNIMDIMNGSAYLPPFGFCWIFVFYLLFTAGPPSAVMSSLKLKLVFIFIPGSRR